MRSSRAQLGELAPQRLELAAERPAEEEVGQLGVPGQQRAVEVRAEDVALDGAVGRRLAAVADADLDLGERLRLGPERGAAAVPLVADERRQAESGRRLRDDAVVHVLAERRAHVEEAQPSVVAPVGRLEAPPEDLVAGADADDDLAGGRRPRERPLLGEAPRDDGLVLVLGALEQVEVGLGERVADRRAGTVSTSIPRARARCSSVRRLPPSPCGNIEPG